MLLFRFGVAIVMLLAIARVACGAGYPIKPIRAIVASAAGGPTDTASRVVGQKMSQDWGQQVIIDNRGGANGNIGSELAARAAPDGYTLLMGITGSMAINPSLYKVPYDPVKDFEPVAMIKRQVYLLVVHPSVPAKTVGELMQLAKTGGYKVTQASSGNASPPHLAGEMMKMIAGVQFVHVPFKGGAPALASVMAGESTFSFIDLFVGMPFIKAGRIKPLAVATPKRLAELPDLPTLTEAGFPNVDVGGWTAMFVPARTPRAIIEKLNAEVRRILAMPDAQRIMSSDGTEFGSNTPEYVKAYLASEIDRWSKVIKSSGVRAE